MVAWGFSDRSIAETAMSNFKTVHPDPLGRLEATAMFVVGAILGEMFSRIAKSVPVMSKKTQSSKLKSNDPVIRIFPQRK